MLTLGTEDIWHSRVMTDILGNPPLLRVYIDDIIIFSDSMEEQTVHLC